MKTDLRKTIVPCLFAMVLAVGCASTKVANRQELVTGQLPRPNNIWVYDFAATAADVPADSALAGQPSATSQTAEQIATGRQLGAQIASELVAQIRSMGLPAAQAGAGTTPQINDIVIRGISCQSTRVMRPSASPSDSAPGRPS